MTFAYIIYLLLIGKKGKKAFDLLKMSHDELLEENISLKKELEMYKANWTPT